MAEAQNDRMRRRRGNMRANHISVYTWRERAMHGRFGTLVVRCPGRWCGRRLASGCGTPPPGQQPRQGLATPEHPCRRRRRWRRMPSLCRAEGLLPLCVPGCLGAGCYHISIHNWLATSWRRVRGASDIGRQGGAVGMLDGAGGGAPDCPAGAGGSFRIRDLPITAKGVGNARKQRFSGMRAQVCRK
jgi:hypothetical protein